LKIVARDSSRDQPGAPASVLQKGDGPEDIGDAEGSPLRRRWPIRAKLAAISLAIFALLAVFGPQLAPQEPNQQDLSNVLQAPSSEHFFGTDQLGRDTFSRIIYGARYTVGITLLATTIGGAIGVLIGLIAGYSRGWLEGVIMRVVDAMLAFPDILLAFVVVGILGLGLKSVVVAMVVISVPIFARFAYAGTLSIGGRDFIEAIKARGASHSRTVLRHVLPNILPEIVIVWSLRLGIVALNVSALSFLGLGVQPPTPEWGVMLSQGRAYMRTVPWLVIFPGVAVSLLIMSFNLLGDGLRDVMDPRGKRY
jgi:ABC-type dipeptide/oligopeptide/nickel transport system permease subunit